MSSNLDIKSDKKCKDLMLSVLLKKTAQNYLKSYYSFSCFRFPIKKHSEKYNRAILHCEKAK